MKKITEFSVLLISVLILFACADKPTLTLEEQLKQLPNVTVKKIKGDTSFASYYELYFTQYLDHNNHKAGKFKQRVLIGNRGVNKPVVVELQGYKIWTEKAGELSKLLNANQITIEHRFFENSAPDSFDWQYLNIKQAATDQHKIIQALKKIYKGKWITTGISKGGQTTIFHRYFFPHDVDASVPYVAPMNLAREDERINQHLENVGDEDTRNKIYQFQLECFKNKAKLLPFAKKLANEKNYHFALDLDKILDLVILEYPFAFWQWGTTSVNSIPENGAKPQELFQHLAKVSEFNFFAIEGIKPLQPFFYQALTQIGMYKYKIDKFQPYLKEYKQDICFDHTFPNQKLPDFDGSAMKKIDKWLKTDADKMLFICGEYDPWNATSVVLDGNKKCKKFVNPKGSHRTRINSFPDSTKTKIIKTIKNWIKK